MPREFPRLYHTLRCNSSLTCSTLLYCLIQGAAELGTVTRGDTLGQGHVGLSDIVRTRAPWLLTPTASSATPGLEFESSVAQPAMEIKEKPDHVLPKAVGE